MNRDNFNKLEKNIIHLFSQINSNSKIYISRPSQVLGLHIIFKDENIRSVYPELIRKTPSRTLEDGLITQTKEGIDVTSLAVQSVGAINELKAEKDAEIAELKIIIDRLSLRIKELEDK